MVMVTYIAALWFRWREGGGHFIGGVDIPQNLLLLSGMSAFTFAAAKGIIIGKQETARAKALKAGLNPDDAAKKAKSPANADERSFLHNLLCNDKGDPDIGDFQMLMVTQFGPRKPRPMGRGGAAPQGQSGREDGLTRARVVRPLIVKLGEESKLTNNLVLPRALDRDCALTGYAFAREP
jgi:hypothetical protein